MRFTTLLAFSSLFVGCGAPDLTGPTFTVPEPAPTDASVDPCTVVSIEPLDDVKSNIFLSPDGARFAANQKDANGIYQVYVGDVGSASVCISCGTGTGAPELGKNKLMVTWHPSGEWIFVGVENEHWDPWIPASVAEAWLQSGLNLDMWVAKSDGSAWFRFTNLKAGYTGPAMSPDGTKAFWSPIVSGNVFAFPPFGKWLLNESDFTVDADGVPSLTNTQDITPEGATWVEPGTVSSDGTRLLLTLDKDLDSGWGMDQWVRDLDTGALTNLNQSPHDWDEHGVFSPSGEKIVFMSSLPYKDTYDAPRDGIGVLTEFILMNKDGTGQQQLTHFNEAGFTESTDEVSLAAVALFTPDGTQMLAAQLLTGKSFPKQRTWRIAFAGRCG